MPIRTSILHSWLSRAGAFLLALSLATPVVHAADPSRKPGASKKKLGKRAEAEAAAKAKARADALKSALDEAQTQRDQALAGVRPLLSRGHHEDAALHLLDAALTYDDAVLHIEAAEQFLAAADRRHTAALARGRDAVTAARTLLAEVGPDPVADERVDVRVVRVPHAQVEALLERCVAVERGLEARAKQLRRQTRGRQELAAGASLLAIGLTGFGVLAGGTVYRAARREELAAIAGHESEYDLSALDAQGRRGDAMIGVGAVLGTVGVVLGASLLALGARDLRGRRAPELASLRVAPTLGGLVLSGRF
ncbi:MAG TPA: hypothetical protein VGB85_22575 [Nannocystis sp.]|jgi:hypothetical protein